MYVYVYVYVHQLPTLDVRWTVRTYVRMLCVPMPLVSAVDSQVLPRVFGAVEEEEMGQAVSKAYTP